MGTHYKEYGNKEGPLLLFIHGGGVGGWMWDKQVAYFMEYHCLVPTLQGHGERSVESSFTIKSNAQEIIELIEEHKRGRDVHLIGFSIGAQIALEILSLAPTLVQSAIINSALVLPMKMASRFIAPSIKLTSFLIKYRAFSRIQAKELYIDDHYFEQYYKGSVNMRIDTLIAVLRENMAYDLPTNIAESTARILVTVGDKEKGIMKKSALKIAASHPNCSSIVISQIGHGFSFAQPERFNQLVDEWLLK